MECEMKWRKSSYSGANGGDCVELAHTKGAMFMRDSKNPNGGMLKFTPGTFSALLTDIKSGKYDR